MNLSAHKDNLGFVKYYALIFVVLAIAFYLGYAIATWHEKQLHQEVEVSRQSIENLTRENQSLNSRINTLQIELEVANLANQQHQKSMQEAHAAQAALKEQLGFYQRVMAPELTQDGFVVERIEVLSTTSDNNYRVSLILLQHEDIKDSVEGELDVALTGSTDGKPASYRLSQLLDEPKSDLRYSFKYFQVLTLSMTLPENFTPQAFEISTDVYKYKRRQGQYNTSVLWSEAYSE